MSCLSAVSSDTSVTSIEWNTKYQLAYEDFWNDVVNSSNFKSRYICTSFPVKKWTNIFPLYLKKSFVKRSTDDENSLDMPVVFIPEKSTTKCVAKPKVFFSCCSLRLSSTTMNFKIFQKI